MTELKSGAEAHFINSLAGPTATATAPKAEFKIGSGDETYVSYVWSENVGDRGNSRYFVCEKLIPPSLPPPPANPCPIANSSDWNKFEQSCYKYFKIEKTKDAAEDYCSKQQVFTNYY